MKVAVTGKGGVGKTTVTAILARTLAAGGHPVVAVDADPNPNLGIALGIGVAATERLDAVANALLRKRADHHHDPHAAAADEDAAAGSQSHRAAPAAAHDQPAREAEDLLDELGCTVPGGVRLLQTGRIERPSDGCLCCGSHRATRQVFSDLVADDRMVVADLEAGVTDLCWTDPKPGDAVVVVSTADRSSVEIARRALQVTRDLEVDRVIVVANRLEDPAEADAMRRMLDGAEVVEMPEDAAITDADRRGVAAVDAAPGSPAVGAVAALAARLLSG
ncbi:MAG: ArsA-related P-loop ATPase [Acidimicrobiales bacterium]